MEYRQIVTVEICDEMGNITRDILVDDIFDVDSVDKLDPAGWFRDWVDVPWTVPDHGTIEIICEVYDFEDDFKENLIKRWNYNYKKLMEN